MGHKDTISARERRLRRATDRLGFALRKVRSGQERGRYRLVDPEFGGAKPSYVRGHPETFSLEEVEAYVEQQPENVRGR